MIKKDRQWRLNESLLEDTVIKKSPKNYFSSLRQTVHQGGLKRRVDRCYKEYKKEESSRHRWADTDILQQLSGNFVGSFLGSL